MESLMDPMTRVTIFVPPPQGAAQHMRLQEHIRALLEYGGGRAVANTPFPSHLQFYHLNINLQLDWERGILFIFDLFKSVWHDDLRQRLGQLKRQLQQEFGRDMIWITIHEIQRIMEGDP